jgi:undecaprenyl diphosphate synthase
MHGLSTVGRQVDILVRSSGETRMSDFMLWQSALACVSFHEVLWPDFSLLDLARSVLDYQRSFDSLCAVRSRHARRVAHLEHQVGDAVTMRPL